MKTFITLFIIAIGIINTPPAFAQTNIFPRNGAVGIGTINPRPSALLEIRSKNKGFLMPRMTEAQRNAINAPVIGLQVYQTDGAAGFYYYNGSSWQLLNGNYGANQDLSNLSDHVAINSSLIPQVSGAIDLGGFEHEWNALWLNGPIWSNGYGVMNIAYDPVNGKDNISIGGFANAASSSAHGAVALGIGSLFNNYGNDNIGIGFVAMSQVFYGSNNVGVGKGANTNTDSISNSTALGTDAIVTASDQVRLGNTTTTSIGGFVGWTTIADKRFNKNLPQPVPGLDFINQLKPITYALNTEAVNTVLKNPNAKFNKQLINAKPVTGNGTQHAGTYTGFFAQDVEAVAKKLNFNFAGIDAPKNARDLYGLRYEAFVVPLVKAVQELSAQNTELKKDVDDLKSAIALLQAQNNAASAQTAVGAKNLNARLYQNAPNPFTQQTTIRYYIPPAATTAFIKIGNDKGETIKVVEVTAKGNGQFNFQTASLAAGSYTYALFIDGNLIDTKKMLFVK